MMQTVDMVIRETHIGIWFLVVGLYFYIFIHLLFFRWRKSKNPFQFATALFFLFLAIGRIFYFVGDFYADPNSLIGTNSGLTPYIEGTLDIWLKAGGFMQWMALATLAATAGFMIFGKREAEIAFAIPAVLIGLGLIIFPYSDINTIAGLGGVLYAVFIPCLFWYLAYQSGGLLRRSNFLLGMGFFVLFAGRVIHSLRFIADAAGILGYTVIGVLAPGLIVIGLILIATGSEWGHTQ